MHKTYMSKNILLSEISNNTILDLAKGLNPRGRLQQQNGYCYLKIDDDYIHEIYPLFLIYGNIKKPEYVDSLTGVGAHISVIYA
jgi:hypothetical protein